MISITKLEPKALWQYFDDICKVPRTSKHEEKITKFLLDFAKEHHLEAKQDAIGNVLITREASPNMAYKETLVLQCHVDMVGEKRAGIEHDWEKDPIIPIIRNGWVMASGTTLGADDGIGMAAQMAILTDPNLKTGKIEALFTVDEETGLTGAKNIQPDFFSGKTLINLDSEDEGIMFIGCAGGMDTIGIMQYQPKPTYENDIALCVSLHGLHGGHSGDEIHKGYGNAVKILSRMLWNMAELYGISLSLFNGGNLRNAIPREATAIFTIDKSLKEEAISWMHDFYSTLLSEYGQLEPEILFDITETAMPQTVMDIDTQDHLLTALNTCPNGVMAWSKDIPGLVETSTNLASVKFLENNYIKITTSQRSSVESSRQAVVNAMRTCFRLNGADVICSDGYPGWQPNMNSRILQVTRQSYRKLFRKEPIVTAIHAGLECGLFAEKIKDIDMISIGPTIRGAHTTEERIDINTVTLFWDLLIDIIENFK
ncbi:MAG: aminoacyl-histidine dipeptidase [Bacteroidales bacterium]|nr:aminoacyl-histidine dipeptidase [Bacteroidales bacterium]